jgi:thiamine pyrophosphate-dependent acetolactate synthase large subunit-like protein
MSAEIGRELTRSVACILNARTPSLVVGPAARSSMPRIVALAHRLGGAVFTTPDAKSLFDETSPYAAGTFSFGARVRARRVAAESDVVIVVGTNFGEFASDAGAAFAKATLVFVGDDPADLPLERHAEITLIGDIDVMLAALAERFESHGNRDRWFDHLTDTPSPSRPSGAASTHGMDGGEAMRALGVALPAVGRVACDITSAALHLVHELKLGPRTPLWLQLERSACMGFALCSGLGIRLASGMPTLVILGDWGFAMTAGELHTVACMDIDRFVVVVWSNGGGALIRNGVRAQQIGVPVELHSWKSPRHAVVATGYGIRAMTVTTPSALRRAVKVGLRWRCPVLIDAIIAPDGEIPGADARYRDLDSSREAQ